MTLEGRAHALWCLVTVSWLIDIFRQSIALLHRSDLAALALRRTCHGWSTSAGRASCSGMGMIWSPASGTSRRILRCHSNSS